MKLIDKILFTYTLIFSLVIFASDITRVSGTATAIPVLLFLPVLAYLAYECLMLYYRRHYAPPMPAPSKTASPNSKPRFSLIRFVSQGGVSFSLSLVLFILCLVTFASKAYLQTHQSEFISPLPSNSSLQSYSNH